MVCNIFIEGICFLKPEIFSKLLPIDLCTNDFWNWVTGLEMGYWLASRNTETILNILISQFSALFHQSLQIISFFF